MAVSPTAADRNYMDLLNGTSSIGTKCDAEFGDAESDLSVNDFFNMMITQLTNQDFMNPVDDTQYLAQMAQFATMQEMMDLCQFSKQNYVMGMLGREVTVQKHEVGGETKTVTGKVDKKLLKNLNNLNKDFNSLFSPLFYSVFRKACNHYFGHFQKLV